MSRDLYSIQFQFLLILFNLVIVFVIFIQFSPNFVHLQIDQIESLYKCYTEIFIFIKIKIYIKYFFHYF